MSRLSVLICALMVLAARPVGVAAEPAPASGPSGLHVEASDFHQSSIYHSPQTPGYTAWCTLWRDPAGSLRLGFQQVTGPVADPHKRSNVTVLLGSDDGATKWRKLREVPARAGTSDQNGIYAAPASSSFCGHGMAALHDGTLVTGLWAGGDRASGYVQRSADGGKTWSAPIYLLDPAQYKTYPTQIRRLHDGRLMLVAGVATQAQARAPAITPYLLKEFFDTRDGGKTWAHVWTMPQEIGVCEESDFAELDNGDLLVVHRAEHYDKNKYINSDRLQNVFHRKREGWEIGPVSKAPFPHSGFPELLRTREGPILHIATDGVWWTADAGTHWTRLNLPGSPYYPQALQLKDGTILVVGHAGGDNVYGSADQSIAQQRFKLRVAK
jgi:hypothetical protein